MVLVDDRVISTKLAFRTMHLVADEFQGFVICLDKELSYESFLLPWLPVMNKCIFIPLIVFISLRPPDIHYRDIDLISNITRLCKVLREAIVLGVLPNRRL